MSDHQPDYNCDDEPAAQATAPDQHEPDQHEPDFSRLRLARARLDNAFPQE